MSKTYHLAKKEGMTHQGYCHRFKKWGYQLDKVNLLSSNEIEILWRKCTLSPQYFYYKKDYGYLIKRMRYGKLEYNFEIISNLKIVDILKGVNSIMSSWSRIKKQEEPKSKVAWRMEGDEFFRFINNEKQFFELKGDKRKLLINLLTAHKYCWIFEGKE